MEEIYVRHVELLGFEKRFFPSQHYVYMLMVKWNDLSEKLIYRGYPEIYTFHKSLKEMFPIEAGDINKKDRIIPELPAPKWLDNQKSTETRQSTLAEYCSSLINLPPKISRSQLVRSLFKVRPEDENPPAQHPLKRNETFVVSNDKTRDNTSEISGPIILESYRVIADYSHTSKYEITLYIGDLVEIVEKSPNGWWFCQCDTKRGWVPASYLEPLDGPEESEEADPNYAGELYITTKAYKAAQDDELTLETGETIEVIHKLLDGWWVVRKGEETGHFPSMFLYRTGEKKEMVSEELVMRRQTPPPRRSTIRNAQSIHSKGRQRISQDTYRRNSRRFLQQKGGWPNQPRKTSKASTQSPLQDWNNRGVEMSLAYLRLCTQHRLALGARGYATHISDRRSREQKDEGPVFQYVGKQRKPNHKVFVWGFSYTGALGIPSFVVPDSGRKKPRKYQLTPYRLETEQQISSAACGYGFTLLSSSTKDLTKVWGMGLNRDSQLGFQRTQQDRYKSYDYVLEPSPVPLPLARPQQTRVVQVACGRAHSLVLTDSEGVFSLGNNAYGQCGRKMVEDEVYSASHIIHKMEGFDSPVTQVVCGQDHSLFLTETGKVYACGWGADGQTGLGHHNMCARPVAVGGDLAGVRVQQVTTYGDCSMAVSQDGQLYGWGNSEYLQLSSVTEATQINSPRLLPFEGVGKVTQVACGGTQVAILNERGEVFVWGYGILGKGPNLSESQTPELVPPTLFGRSEFNPAVTVSRIHCGLNHFAAVTDRGELFVWGKNVRGCLGIGKKEDQYFPWRVTVPGHVVDVACGVDHMVALVKSVI